MTDTQVTRIPKLTRTSNFRAWSVQLEAVLTTADEHDRFLNEEPDLNEPAEVRLDKQARAKLIMCLGPDMVSLVEGRTTTRAAFEALRQDHLGHAVSMRSELLAEVTAMRQSPKQSVKDYVAVGREYILRLRDVGVEHPATLLIPCFKAGIEGRLKQQVLPLLNQTAFDTDFEALAQEFQRITVGMSGAQAGTGGQAHATRQTGADRGKPKREWVEQRTCFICNTKGHVARKCPQRKTHPGDNSGSNGPPGRAGMNPTVLLAQTSSEPADDCVLLFDSGATHHIVNVAGMLRAERMSSVGTITLGGGEIHHVMSEGELLIHSHDTRKDILLTNVLWVPTLSYSLCSGAQLTSRGQHVVCTQQSEGLSVKLGSVTLMLGDRVNNLYHLRCDMIPPAEGQVHVTLGTWHKRLSHPSMDVVQRMSNQTIVRGLGECHKEKALTCDSCDAAKQHKVSHPRSESRAARVCALVHTDLLCPTEEGLLTEESSYVLTVLDDHSRYSEIAILSSKDEATTVFMRIIARMERQTSQKLQKIRFDRGSEYFQLKGWMADEGIVPQPTPAGTPQANGRAERLNRTLIERVRALLHQFDLPVSLWHFAIQVAAYTRNMTPSVDMSTTPYEIFWGEKPDVSYLRTFGCLAKVFVPADKRGKFDKVHELGMMVGYAERSAAWRILVDTSHGLIIRESQNVLFDEECTHESLRETLRSYPDADVSPAVGSYVDLYVSPSPPKPPPVATEGAGDVVPAPSPPAPSPAISSENTMSLLGGSDPESSAVEGTADAAEGTAQSANESEHDAADAPRRNPGRNRRPPERLHEGFTHLTTSVSPPKNFAEAKERFDWPLWRDAMHDEMTSFCEKKVYEDMPLEDKPEERKTVPTMWVYDYKTDNANAIIGRKARCVALGCRQTPGADFVETTAPTIQDGTLRALLQFAASQKLAINQIDVKTAFLNGELVEEVYIMPPPGFAVKGRVWRLNKALYGLKQAANVWYRKWVTVMVALGLKPSQADPCLFVGKGDDGSPLRVGLYVDDALLFGNSSQVQKLVGEIETSFEIKDMGLLTPGKAAKFLGMEVLRCVQPDLGIFLSQRRYAEQVLERFGMQQCKPVTSAMTPGVHLEHEGKELPEGNDYGAIVGSLLYLAVKTRPDIAYAVGVLSRFVSCPREPHYVAVKRVLRYIAKDPGAGIFFSGTKEGRGVRSMGTLYSDADFAGDSVMRKSTSGIVFMLGGAPIVWRSKLQTIVAQSTCEAEFVAAAAAVREGLWIQKMLVDVQGMRGSLQLCCDNESAITLLESTAPKVTGRTKHIELQFWFVIDHIMKQEVMVQYVPTDQMVADPFTKPYNGDATQRAMSMLGMRSGWDIKV